ncbi:MAG TPA: class I SAM-dependent methyltransferase [Acidimicrobiales bacterium]|nr:class I SAM-dependent methyltransferase [Acidimicrobiales bacterium]
MTHHALAGASTTHFGPLKIVYDARVLAPRPWTINQSYWACEAAKWAPRGPILELHCGAGHVGLAAARLSHRPLVQLDRDVVACEFAVANAARAGLGDAVEVRVAELPEGLRDTERFPIILADPPYVPTEMVRGYPDDPVGAIDGGADGLDGVRTCLDVATRHLDDLGLFILQLGTLDQAERVADLATDLEVLGRRSIDGAGFLLGLQHLRPEPVAPAA